MFSLKQFLILDGLIGYMLLFCYFSFYHCYSLIHPLMTQGFSCVCRICKFKPLQLTNILRCPKPLFLGTFNVYGLLRQRANWSSKETRLKKFFHTGSKKEEILYDEYLVKLQ